MKKIHFMSAALMAILLTSMGGLQQATALMGTDVIPAGGVLDFYELLDGSGSVSGSFATEIGGTVAAFTAALTPDQFGKVRVTVIQFSTGAVQECQFMINNAGDVTALNACVNGIVFQNGGATCIACAYDLVTASLLNPANPIQGVNDRSIVDLVTDGNPNSGNTAASFAAALAAGLDSSVVLGVGAVSQATLLTLTHPNQAGAMVFNAPIAPGSLPDPLVQGFVILVAGFAEFEAAMLEKFTVISDPDVGGELLNIDTAALLVAGAQSNAVWLLSALAVIGSVAFGAFYINSRKQ